MKRLARTGRWEMIRFNATCPNGHTGVQTYYKDHLHQLVDRDRLRLWCTRCDVEWDVTDEEMEALRRLLRIRE